MERVGAKHACSVFVSISTGCTIACVYVLILLCGILQHSLNVVCYVCILWCCYHVYRTWYPCKFTCGMNRDEFQNIQISGIEFQVYQRRLFLYAWKTADVYAHLQTTHMCISILHSRTHTNISITYTYTKAPALMADLSASARILVSTHQTLSSSSTVMKWWRACAPEISQKAQNKINKRVGSYVTLERNLGPVTLLYRLH